MELKLAVSSKMSPTLTCKLIYKFKGQELETAGGKMNLVNHAKDVVALEAHLKAHPLPVV